MISTSFLGSAMRPRAFVGWSIIGAFGAGLGAIIAVTTLDLFFPGSTDGILGVAVICGLFGVTAILSRYEIRHHFKHLAWLILAFFVGMILAGVLVPASGG